MLSARRFISPQVRCWAVPPMRWKLRSTPNSWYISYHSISCNSGINLLHTVFGFRSGSKLQAFNSANGRPVLKIRCGCQCVVQKLSQLCIVGYVEGVVSTGRLQVGLKGLQGNSGTDVRIHNRLVMWPGPQGIDCPQANVRAWTPDRHCIEAWDDAIIHRQGRTLWELGQEGFVGRQQGDVFRR